MFNKKRSEEPTSPDGAANADESEQTATPSQGKGRPTPSRRQAQAARRQPLVPADRKAAKRRDREHTRQERYKTRVAMERGEEWALPARDRGPERKFVRDVIDARRSFAEFILPVMVVGLPISLIPNRTALLAGYLLVYGALLIAVIDTTVLWFHVKKRVRAKFGHDPARGTLWYVISRAVQLRPGRLPKPQVKRGEKPE